MRHLQTTAVADFPAAPVFSPNSSLLQVFPVPLPDNQTVPHAWAASLAYSPTLGRAASLSWPSTTQGHSTLTMHPGGGAHGGWHAGAGGPGVSGKSVIGGHLGAGNPRAETILEDDGTGGEDDK